MPRKKRWSFFPTRRRKSPDRSALFLFLVVLVSGLVVMVLAQQASLPERAVSEAPATKPDYAKVLPPGTDMPGVKEVELIDSPTPAYAVAYSVEGQAVMSLVVWSKPEGKYVAYSPLVLAGNDVWLTGVTKLSIERLGSGVPTLLFAQGPTGSSNVEQVIVVAREGLSLRLVEKTEADVPPGTAFFPVDASVMDVNSDGVKEVMTKTVLDGKTAIKVYSWSNGRLEYNEQLSWAMTTDAQLFPVPPGPTQ